jgi:hypothetical protein
MTEINDQYRKEQIIKCLLDYKESKQTKTLTLPYKDRERTFEVIRIDPKVLLLNPHNSRLSAQLEDHPQRAIVLDDSRSEAAQEILSNLLKNTPEFQELKRELKELGQREPGLISRSGLLINGNTRVVALRDLAASGVDVAVLPEDADDRVFLDLEMSLQMTKLTHQDYTFTNQLLLMQKYHNEVRDEKLLALKMNWLRSGKTKVEQHMRYLNLINEVRSLTTPPIRYQEFDLKSEHIRNLVETYESTKTISIKDANNMKWTRITAMFLGVNKDQTRAIDEDFIEEDIVKQLDPNSVEKKFLDTLKKVDIEDGLDGLLGDSQDDREKVDSRLLCIKTISTLIDSEGSISKDLTPELEGIFNAIRRGSEAIINKSKDETYKKSPIRKLEDAREIIEEVVQRFHEVKLAKDFESSAFKYQLKKLRKTLDDLADEVDKS